MGGRKRSLSAKEKVFDHFGIVEREFSLRPQKILFIDVLDVLIRNEVLGEGRNVGQALQA